MRIVSSHKYLPRKLVPASELDTRLNLKPGTCQDKSGVNSRHFVSEFETVLSMAKIASQGALKASGLSWKDIDVIVYAGATAYNLIPCNAALIQKELGLEESGIPCFDINATCLSFVVALNMLADSLRQNSYRRVLLVSSEISSLGINWQHLESACLFGDGAAAFIVENDPTGDSAKLSAQMQTYSSGSQHCMIYGGASAFPGYMYDGTNKEKYLFAMDGTKVFKQTLKYISDFYRSSLQKAQVTPDEIKLVIPHQASKSAMDLVKRKLEIPDEKWVSIIEDHGNCISASIPMALHEAIVAGRLRRGDCAMLIGTGAGLSIASLVFKY